MFVRHVYLRAKTVSGVDGDHGSPVILLLFYFIALIYAGALSFWQERLWSSHVCHRIR